MPKKRRDSYNDDDHHRKKSKKSRKSSKKSRKSRKRSMSEERKNEQNEPPFDRNRVPSPTIPSFDESDFNNNPPRDGGESKRDEWGKKEDQNEAGEEPAQIISKPDFGLSGNLSKDTKTGNTRQGTVLKFNVPKDARVPRCQWRVYVYKNKEDLGPLFLRGNSHFLLGRNSSVCDLPLAHPSISSQHALIAFRDTSLGKKKKKSVRQNQEEGGGGSKPYLMDLESTNGTFLNGSKIEATRYYQILNGDSVKFGESTREYVFINEEEVKKK